MVIPYSDEPRPSIGPWLAIKRFFSNPTQSYHSRNLKISELKALSASEIYELAPLCAKEINCELRYVSSAEEGSRL